MAKKKPYTITENEDKTVNLQISGITKRFRDRKALQAFAEHLYEMVSYQRTGMFRLKEKDDESVDLIFNSGGEILHSKNYDNFSRLAMSILEELEQA